MKFEVVVDKHLNVKEIWYGDNKLRFIENVRLLCTPERTHITFDIMQLGIEFILWEVKYGTRTKKNMGK